MNQEREIHVPNGWLMLLVNIAILAFGGWLTYLFVLSCIEAEKASRMDFPEPMTVPMAVKEHIGDVDDFPATPSEAEAAREAERAKWEAEQERMEAEQAKWEEAREQRANATPNFWLLVGSVLVITLGCFLCAGHFTLQPNEGRVLILFGSYRGTVRRAGFHWTNPLNTKMRLSLRSRNLNGEKLKVNDKRGNPVEIAVVVVWRVQDTAQACFDVDDFEEYVRVQSESAVRHLANCYPYDHGVEGETTLRSGMDEIAEVLQDQLQERVAKAGVTIEEARVTHLAYAAEIAGAMLRRQQAEAIIDARQKIVHGAVSMVQMALDDLAKKEVVELDEERKAAMVSNLLVILCGEAEAQPVINTGTLYS